jgi:hypothetical protein
MQAAPTNVSFAAQRARQCAALACALAMVAGATTLVASDDVRQPNLVPQYRPEQVPAPPGMSGEEPGDAEPQEAACDPTAGPMFESGGPTWKDEEPAWIAPGADGAAGRFSWFRNCFLLPPSNGRYRDIGSPLTNDSWLNRPYSIGLLTGGLLADTPIRNHVNGTSGYLIGARLGWDVEYFWGVETRIASSYVGLRDAQGLQRIGNMGVFLWDSNILYYPLGDTQWRPFAIVGLGMGQYRFTDDLQNKLNETTFSVPFGGGLKYRHNSAWAFRIDLIDNLSLRSGSGLATMQNISLTAGLEAHFGIGPRRSYWPWNPTRSFR